MLIRLALIAICLAPIAGFAAETKRTPSQILRSIADSFADIEEARFGKAPKIPQGDKSLSAAYKAPREQAFVRRNDESSCGRRDNLRKKLGPARNQGGLGWCFGSVAADILSLQTGRRVSDLDLSLQYFRHQKERRTNRNGEQVGAQDSVTKFWAGSVGEAINVASATGLCREGAVQNPDFMHRLFLANAEEFNNAAAMKSDQYVNSVTFQLIERSVGRNLEQLIGAPEQTCWSVLTAKTLLPNLSSWQVIATLSSAQSKEEAMHWLFNQACKREPVKLPPKTRFVEVQGLGNPPYGGQLFEGVDMYLDEDKPIAIGYDAKRVLASAVNDPKVKVAPHAGLIVGREFRDGSCQYLVRNSGGSSCSQFAAPYNSRRRCERGHFWITEEELNPMIMNMGVLSQ